MSIYGEGLYRDADGRLVASAGARARAARAAATGSCAARTARRSTPVPTPETKTPSLASVYALSKYDQERLCLMVGRAYGIPTVALRFFNVYGTRQALSNPYTGVLAIFASRLLNGNPPLIFEDGLQRRDFVSVDDVAQALPAGARRRRRAAGQVVQRRQRRSPTPFARSREDGARSSASAIEPEITRQVPRRRHPALLRRHLARAQVLGYEPQVSSRTGLAELAEWLEGQVGRRRSRRRPPARELAATGA